MACPMSSPSAGAQPGFIENFTQLLKQPRALWIVIGAFVVEAMAYFGILTVMASYFSSGLGWGDVKAGMAVSFFTMSVLPFFL